MARFVLSLQCPDRPGVVHAASKAILSLRGNVTDSQQFSDPETGTFCLRTAFDVENHQLHEIEATLQEELDDFSVTMRLRSEDEKRRIMILVSNVDHCLVDLLYRRSIGELDVEVPLVVGNHPEPAEMCAAYGVDFLHLPTEEGNKNEVEEILRRKIEDLRIDLVVLARYMQVLSPEFCQAFESRIINIHHSFLPGFKGARPYHQAYQRGVKLIGATAHYVTSELDEGPIIEQDVARVSHRHEPADLIAIGRDLERTVLSRAVHLHIEDRIVLLGKRTAVFYR
jgi:formyltetrahydrofolate deformylase